MPVLQGCWWISTGNRDGQEVTQALTVAADTKDFGPLQEVLEAWTATVRLQQQPG
jgi:hypothetical protein